MPPKLPLPRGWKRRVRSSVLHILALGHYHLLEQRTFTRRTHQYTGRQPATLLRSALKVLKSAKCPTIQFRHITPMAGGLMTSFLLELTVYPALFAVWKGRSLRR